MKSRRVWALLVCLVGIAAYGGIALATPPAGVANPPWSPVIGHFESGIDGTTKTDVDSGTATDFWQVRISAKGPPTSTSWRTSSRRAARSAGTAIPGRAW